MTINGSFKGWPYNRLPEWVRRNKLINIANGGEDSYNSVHEPSYDIATADAVTSVDRVFTNFHKPVLDIDFPAALIPSSTPGHFHLYLDRDLTWDQYCKLLYALEDANIIQPEFRRLAFERGYTTVRLPWISKKGKSFWQKITGA